MEISVTCLYLDHIGLPVQSKSEAGDGLIVREGGNQVSPMADIWSDAELIPG